MIDRGLQEFLAKLLSASRPSLYRGYPITIFGMLSGGAGRRAKRRTRFAQRSTNLATSTGL